jgi:hypothetical protein
MAHSPNYLCIYYCINYTNLRRDFYERRSHSSLSCNNANFVLKCSNVRPADKNHVRILTWIRCILPLVPTPYFRMFENQERSTSCDGCVMFQVNSGCMPGLSATLTILSLAASLGNVLRLPRVVYLSGGGK